MTAADPRPQRREQIEWPGRTAVLSRGRHGDVREFLKYYARLWMSLPYRAEFLSLLDADPAMRELFAAEPRLFHSPLSRFLDRRFSMSERFATSEADLRRGSRLLGPTLLRRLAHGDRPVLFEDVEGYAVTFGLNEVNLQEGLWCLAIRDPAQQRLYSLSFGFLPDGAVLVGSLQGARLGGDEALAFARQFTKTAHGLRPPAFLFETLRALCGCWGIDRILGIDPVHHIKGRWNQRRKRLKFDYRGFWHEQGAHRDGDGYWSLAATAPSRDLGDVPSKKRSMYRKRFDMLDELRSSLTDFVDECAWR